MQYFRTMTISAAATTTPRSWRIPSQHWVRHDCPHRNTTHDPPVAWFGQICFIFGEIAPSLQCKIFYTAAFHDWKPGRWVFSLGKLNVKAAPLKLLAVNH
jgi:hypothetical protein